ncbi:DUF1080 domain-containing protein, partial [Micromonospora echinofusca]
MSRKAGRLGLLAATSATLVVAVLGLTGTASAATLFIDDFSDGNHSGWSQSGGTWSVVTDDSQVLHQAKADTDNARLFAGSSSWTDYAVQARVKPLTLPADGAVGLLARASGSTTFHRLVLLPGDQVRLEAVKSGASTVLGTASRTVGTGTWYTLKIEVAGNTVRGYVDGTLIGSGTSTVSAAGRIGVQTRYATARYDDVTVTTGGTTPT